MDDATVDLIMRELRARHRGPAMRAERVVAEMETALRRLPQEGTWAIASGQTPAVYARSGETLYTALVDATKGRLLFTFRKLDGYKLVGALEFDEPRDELGAPGGQRTKWTFRLDGETTTWLKIDGLFSVLPDGTEQCDTSETFARELAGLAGWPDWCAQAGEPLIELLG
jgi:hypothetical protein